MPGHIKLGKPGEPDPDPSPYLIVSLEMKREDMLKPYDPKKSVWVPTDDHGFREGLLESDDGTKAVVMCGHEKKVFPSNQVGQVNPPKFEKCEDMANLTFLNDGSVFHNLEVRYKAKLIYTYSGLFCVVVNPYKRFPIYTQTVVKWYVGKRRNEVPPHLWAISETAYRNMLTNTKDQSMLITGESGAGKTENTKKVITYLALVAASGKKQAKKVSLEDQIVATNPILESYGNAKTSRNDNSSRFGKFIRIHFTTAGKLTGCDIESYLLEKSRITEQQEVERSYHIFYQLLQPFVPDMKAKCLLTDDIYDYSYVSQGKVTVASIDDNEELEFTDNAFDVIGFSNEEKWDCYKLTAAVMACGEIKFKQKGRDDQAEPDDMTFPNKVAELFGVNADEMMKSFCKPKIKVGTEWVTKGQTCEQATYGVGGIARATFDRIFKWLIIKCNETLIDPTMKKANFTAVLDIAGFEIFEYNGFEQISINFVNEKLQQFFNHHMFVVEQEEYVAEGIDWAMVDFGMDLAACIIMFEKPMGIWAILEEESLFPKATDKSFEEKLKAQHLGKSPSFAKPQSKTDKNAHFACIHYAGTVSYNVTGWLEKNKDPVNDTVVDVLKRASNKLLVLLWADHPGQTAPPEEDKTKKKKKGAAKTVSSVYLVQLAELMHTLHCTEPHFIRCIVPNTHKQPGMVEPPLIMHQLTCNGVLEGIRICMRGFPNRMMYPDFKGRYQILGAAEIASSSDNKTAVYALLDKIEFSREKYRLGHTKVFFRAGALAALEEARDEIVIKLVRYLQGTCYGVLRRRTYQKKADQRELLKVIQRNFRKYMALRNWGWFIIIQKTRPLIGQVNIEEELRLLEDKAKEAYGAYEEALNVTKELEAANIRIDEEKKALTKQLESEQGNLSVYQERQAKAAAMKADLENQLADIQAKLAAEERSRQEMTADKKKMEGEIGIIKKDIEDLELALQKLEQEKTNRDHNIRSLNDEVAAQDEVINKLNKEKKSISDNQAKAAEDLQAAEDKVNHLNSIKTKLEQTLDELEDSVNKEKRQRADLEKQRRKVEGDLKMAQETVAELEQSKKELENIIQRKEKDIGGLNAKLEDEQSLVSKVQKQIKEYQGRVEELEEELEAERQARAKAERQRSDLAKELEELGERLNEAGGATHAQIELNKKRDAEVQKLRKDLEEVNIQHESILQSLKKKHQDAIQEMSEQIDQLSKMKAKIEKDKSKIQHEIADARAATDEIGRAKASSEKSNKNLLAQLNELSKKVEEANMTLGDFESHKRKLAAENADLLRIAGDIGNNVNMLHKVKQALQASLDETKHVADNEARERNLLLGKFKNLEHEVDGLKSQLDEESAAREDVLRQTKKADAEASLWRQKYETEAVAKAEELEMSKMKLQARLTEADSTIENLNSKLVQIEKSRAKLQSEIEEMSVNLDQAQILNNAMEKKARQFDKIVGEWKQKVDGLSMDLDIAQKECRNASSDLFRVKAAYEESVAQLDEVRRENKSLSNEIKDIMDQISEGGRSIHEIDKIRKRLEAEKLELTAALEEAEGALEQEENKVLRAQLELTQVRQEIERRIAEKEEEFQGIKKNQSKAVEGMQSALEQESKAKAEALRMKKKLEADVSELEMSLEHANANNLETQKAIKKYQQQIRECQAKLEDEQRAKEAARDALVAAERKAHAMQNALEEARTLLEQADRNRRTAEQELSDVNEQLSDATVQNQAIAAAKRKLESEMQTLHAELDEMAAEARLCEDKAAKAMVDAARLADELRAEQDAAQHIEKERRLLEAQAKDMHQRLDDAETNALKGGKKAMNKMESRIRELESELDAENRRLADAQKNLRRSERHIKELTFAADEDRKNHERMQALIDQLQGKIRSYKKQIEEAEEIAALNLAKFRKVQGSLSEASERADLNEQALGKARARGRSASLGPK
jgi:myosin heavy chain 6/7